MRIWQLEYKRPLCAAVLDSPPKSFAPLGQNRYLFVLATNPLPLRGKYTFANNFLPKCVSAVGKIFDFSDERWPKTFNIFCAFVIKRGKRWHFALASKFPESIFYRIPNWNNIRRELEIERTQDKDGYEGNTGYDHTLPTSNPTEKKIANKITSRCVDNNEQRSNAERHQVKFPP